MFGLQHSNADEANRAQRREKERVKKAKQRKRKKIRRLEVEAEERKVREEKEKELKREKEKEKGRKKRAAKKLKEENALQLQQEVIHDDLQRQYFHHPSRYAFQQSLQSHNAQDYDFVDMVFRGSSSSCSGPSKNYTLVSAEQLVKRLQKAREPELLLLIDENWFNNRPSLTLNDFLDELAEEPEHLFDVQELDHLTSLVETKLMPGSEIVERLRCSDWTTNLRSLNMLNISGLGEDLLPPGLARYCGLLSEACMAVSSEAENRIRAKDTHKPVMRKAGLESCLGFGLCGQAGSLSHWHVDNNGVITWVTIEKTGGCDEDVVKFWAVVNFDGHTTEQKTAAEKEFARLGTHWKPDPAWIRVFPLRPGYTLIMPPGTIHAVITLANCLVRGGMRWDPRFLTSHHLPVWAFTSQHRDRVTNEDPANQTLPILRYLQKKIEREFTKGNLSNTAVTNVKTLLDTIAVNSTPCTCKRCNRGCPCRKLKHQCYSDCTTRGCDNVE